jgi:Fe-S-cluster containining protein
MGSILCEHCSAACCRYLAIEIDKPTTARDYDDIRWYLMHEGISVFVEDGEWYLQIQTRCKNLLANNLCGIYETRPQICREYEPGDCDYSAADSSYEHLFTHPSQIEELYFRRTGKRLGEPKPPTRRAPARRNSAKGRATPPARPPRDVPTHMHARKHAPNRTRPAGRGE